MKKIILVLLGIIGILAVGLAAAHGYNTQRGTGEFHEQMESIMEHGNYQDLANLREETGHNMMRWVQSQEDFETAQERHAYMVENGLEGQGMHKGYGRGQGCMG